VLILDGSKEEKEKEMVKCRFLIRTTVHAPSQLFSRSGRAFTCRLLDLLRSQAYFTFIWSFLRAAIRFDL